MIICSKPFKPACYPFSVGEHFKIPLAHQSARWNFHYSDLAGGGLISIDVTVLSYGFPVT